MNINKTQAFVFGTLALGLVAGVSAAVYLSKHKDSKVYSYLDKRARNIKSDLKKGLKRSENSVGKRAESMLADANNRMDDDGMARR